MKRLQKIIPVCLLALVLIIGITLLTPKSQAVTILDSGTCGSNLTWTYDSSRTLTISGVGAMEDKYWDEGPNMPWVDYLFKAEHLVIESGVTSLGQMAFWNSTISSVTIADSVTVINYGSFMYCYNLGNVYYSGSKNQWDAISISGGNQELTAAVIHYNHTHDYSLIPAKTVQPTCDQDGYVEYTCVLGDTYREYTPALGHIGDGNVTVYAPTCTVQGYKEFVCTRCAQTVRTEYVDALGHDFNGTRTQILGCTEQGYTEIQCTRCSATTKTDYTDSVGHNVVVIQLKDPTCTEEGISRIGTMCDRCGTVLAQPETIPALGHDLSSGICSRCQMSVQDEYVRIVKEAYALAPGDQLPYKATLTGTITKVKTAYDSAYKNVTVIIEVEGAEDMPVTCYRLKGDGASKIGVGDIITVSGYITNYQHGSGDCEVEFVQGCALDSWTDGGSMTPPDASDALQTGDKVIIFASAYNKALSADKMDTSSFYNKGVDITVSNGIVSGYSDSEIWTVTNNGDGTYSFANGGKNIGMSHQFSNLNLGEPHDDWQLVSLGGSLYNVKNTVRGNYIEWYDAKGNWSTYNSSYATTDDQFQLSFFVIGKGILSEKVDNEKPIDPNVPSDMAQIVRDAYALVPGDSLDYKATLTGTITKVKTAYDSTYKNVTVIIEVAGAEGMPITCYRLAGNGADKIGVGDIITVSGYIENFQHSSGDTEVEFKQGCTLDSWWIGGELTGDLTGDNSVNNDDVVLLLWHTLFPEDYPLEVNADLTGDGTVNNDDVVLLLWHTLFPDDYPL